MRYKDIIAKMRENEIKDFSQAELSRVFKNCASPEACKRGVYIMLHDNFTIDEIYTEKQLSLLEPK
jgi:hypothetical protein